MAAAVVQQFVDEEEEEVPEEEEEEDVVDPQDELKEKCAELSKCSKMRERLDECNDRVSSRTKTMETCTEEMFDFVHCVDHCVAKNLFQKLK